MDAGRAGVPGGAKDDRELIDACRRGDDNAFQELVNRYKDLVFALVSRSSAGRARAEDLAQEVFLRVHRGLPYFRGDAKLSTWIYRIVANVCSQSHERAPGAASLDDPQQQHLVPAVADRHASDLELRDRLEKAIARLPPNYQLLIGAHYLRGVQYEDLAEALDLPLGTVKTHLHRAKQQLRRLLDSELR